MRIPGRHAFDAVVVGSGPGGAAVARGLSNGGKRVLILERGQSSPIKGTMGQGIAMMLVPGRSLLFTPELAALVRGVTLGGSSIAAYATAFEPPFAMFDGYGVDLRGDVAETKCELPIAPLADRLVGPAARRIMASARQLGLAWDTLPKIVFQDKCRPDCDKCTQGCPFGAKWTARMYVDEALAQGAVLLTGANVQGLTYDGDRVTGVQYLCQDEMETVSAPLVVLAAGGIGTPLILRASGVRNAGHDFFFDPLVVVMGEVDDLSVRGEVPMTAGLMDAAEGYVLTDLVWPRWIYDLFVAQVLRFDRLTAYRRTLPVMVKVKDELGGGLTSWGGVGKRLSSSDRERLARGSAVARRILQNAGARNIFSTWHMATHPGGTAKIGDVVDANLKTKFANLYICDCSVIPQAWGRPPTLTLLALGRRLARHLLAKE
jgi:choline dehydrogenase-like flavoprotein